jgi:hypothetical protein
MKKKIDPPTNITKIPMVNKIFNIIEFDDNLYFIDQELKLIWDTNDIEKMYQIKIQLEYAEYLPTFLKELIIYVRNLNFEKEPNYKYIIDTIRSQIR